MNKAIAILLIFLSLGTILCDLPVHCLKHQVVGEWKLYIGSPNLKGMGPSPCGHHTPDSDKSSYQAGWDGFNSNSNVNLILKDDFTVTAKDQTVAGSWTMVYDEGFEIVYKHTKYFAFSKYDPEGGSKAKSYCDSTLMGWYNNQNSEDRGCYWAEKTEKISQSESLDQVSVVQPEFMNQDQLNKLSFIQLPQAKPKKQDHQAIVDKINKSGAKWQAQVYPNMIGKTFAQINKQAGRRKFFQGTKSSSTSFLQTKEKISEDVSGFPKNLSYEKFIKPARSQEECGSCYTIAAMAMLSSRLRRQGTDVTLSVQHSLNCNYYNQGCDGGYPFLVSKWASEEYMIPERSEPYMAKDGECDQSKAEGLSQVYGVKEYRYIGGSYGKSSEKQIMQELQRNGPVIMNFEPTFEFMYYKEGIFHSQDAEWVNDKQAKPEWEKVDHSVMCYGWGEEDGEKYWLLQNSWGTDWGENGNFRVRRGGDDSAIESMGEAADPTVINRTLQSHQAFVQQKQNLRKYE